MKKGMIFTIILIGLILSMSNVSAGKFTYLKAYYDSLNDKCISDSDCIIANVENCCGYYALCINKNSVLNPQEVMDICSKEKNVTDCKERIVAYCRCQKTGSSKTCLEFTGRPRLVCNDGNCFKEELDPKDPNYCPQDCGGNKLEEVKNETNQIDVNNTENKTEVVVCPQLAQVLCPQGAEIKSQGNDEKNCPKQGKCIKKLSNGIESEIKIMPDSASQKAISKLGELGFNVSLEEVGNGNNVKAVYQAKATVDAKIFGFIKKKAIVEADIDSSTGEIISIKKPWWSFIASGI